MSQKLQDEVQYLAVSAKENTATSQEQSTAVKEIVATMEDNTQLSESAESNAETIEGIKSLGGKIENIWNIVTLINSIADQAKIIAFNAELEAVAAGDVGKNFHIVASEIRRLADGIIDGTREIKQQITEIQDSSDSLILASEGGTEKINAGVAGAQTLSAWRISRRRPSRFRARRQNSTRLHPS